MEAIGLLAATLPSIPSISRDAHKFCSCFEQFGNFDEAGHELRGRLWHSIDSNGSGYVSLAEAGLWIKTSLMKYLHDKDETERIYKEYYPMFIRAFKDAADIGQIGKAYKGGQPGNDATIEKGEFRHFTIFLCIYALIYDSFRLLDGSRDVAPQTVFGFAAGHEDRKILLAEWRLRHQHLAGSPFLALSATAVLEGEHVDAAFAKMDADGAGAILFVEFCEFVKAAEVAAGTPIGKVLSVGDDN